MKKILLACLLLITTQTEAQNNATPFEKSKGTQSTTYKECITYYKQLTKLFKTIRIDSMSATDAGYPLHLVLCSMDKTFDPGQWHKQHKVVILVNNGIHAGEPDGIDASMMLVRDLAMGKIKMPANVVLGIIPVYNIGGCLNRTGYSRVNQNGPESYGFRGNSQNLDLNRDFIKSDSKEAKGFAKIYHYLNPDIFVDNHVSDGADYQHTMTLLTTQHNKLDGAIGDFLHTIFEPALYKSMDTRGWQMTPYVNFEQGNPDKGWDAYYDSPRYSSGYTTLFQTMGFVPETHMLKPYADRVRSTYDLMLTMIEQASKFSGEIIQKRKESIEAIQQQQAFPLTYTLDSTRFDNITFLGYETGKKKSDVTGMDRLFYDHAKPYSKQVKFYNYFTGSKMVTKPKAYIIPHGWQNVIELLQLNHVIIQQLHKDTLITVEAYHIDDYKTANRSYEKHYRHSDVKVTPISQTIQFLAGDYIISTGQQADRFLVETLEPTGDDSYFSWGFFDAILQQKEGYSNYRWEDVAGPYLQQHPELKQLLEDKKKEDPQFAVSANAQLEFVYQHSPWYEPAHLRYPVYRLEK